MEASPWRGKCGDRFLEATLRIFVYEHIVGGGASREPHLSSLLCEGRAMLEAISSDLARLPGVSVATILHESVEPLRLGKNVDVLRASTPAETCQRFDALARGSDGALVIAPETDGELARLAARVQEVGGRHLGSTPDAINLASDKLLLPGLLSKKGIPAVPATAFNPQGPDPFSQAPGRPLVLKPRRGAGSTETFLLEGSSTLPEVKRESIVTPFTPGLPASVLILSGPRTTSPLLACEQVLSNDGRFRYLGGRLPLPPDLAARAVALALRAVDAIPGLLGFVGVDLLLQADRGRDACDQVVEVNPRLTTSYVGLQALSRVNLAKCWLSILLEGWPPPLDWRRGRLRFFSDGRVEDLNEERLS